MTDSDSSSDDMAVCEFCDDEYKARGLATHQRFCDEAEATDGTDDTDETDDEGDTNTSVNRSDFEDSVLERDDFECRRCGATDGLVVHPVDEEIGEVLNNNVTLCADCEADIEDYRPVTKRTAIANGA